MQRQPSRPGTFRDKLMTALRTSGVGSFEKMWRQQKIAQKEAAIVRHIHAVEASAQVTATKEA